MKRYLIPILALLFLLGCVQPPSEKPKITYFTATPSTVEQGGTVTLSWSVSNADKVTLEGIGSVSISGTMSVSPNQTTTYRLIAENAAGSSEAIVQVVVSPPQTPTPSPTQTPTPQLQPPSINYFTVSPSTINQGENATLLWSVEDATEVYINGEEVEGSGTMAVSPSENTTYQLLAVNPAGMVTENVTLIVEVSAILCGDGICEAGETPENCCMDCGCPADFACEDGVCQEIPANATPDELSPDIILQLPQGYFGPTFTPGQLFIPEVCGDALCTGDENSSTCCDDCGCPSGQLCSNNTCVNLTIPSFHLIPIIHAFPLPGGGEALTYTEPQTNINSITVEKVGGNLKIKLNFKDASAMNAVVKSNEGPKIYFDYNGDGSADVVTTVWRDNFYVWKNILGGNAYEGSTSCSENECSVEMPWDTVFGATSYTKMWVSIHSTNERLPSISALGLQWSPSFSLNKSHEGEPYIVVTLDRATVYNDQDRFREGEIMFFLAAKSGNVNASVNFPMKIWYELNSGDTILGGEENAVPVFAAKESEMGDNLTIVLAAADNDEWPGWITAIFDVLTGKIFIELIDADAPEVEVLTPNMALERFTDMLGRNDPVGVHVITYTKGIDWGVKDGFYEAKAKDLGVRYSIRRVYVPKNLMASVKSYGIKIHSHADSNRWCCDIRWAGGEFYSWTRVSSGFKDGYLESKVTRCPNSGTTCVCKGWVKCPTYAKEDFGNRVESKTLFYGQIKGPFLYTEIAAWDKDNPDIGDDDDPLGTLAKTWVLDESFFDWELGANKPVSKHIDRREVYSGVSGGRIEIDLGVVIWQS